ncbi:dsDNA nuclease domain-containing protein [Salipiger mangrovisoli]|uniref:DUF4297 domain-containing protein n=1 Tax=Salipiger mangrovisoli TaxID=2865933 RepID=A0ABR9X6L3_9RHOB|nr:dsDNA nuclease domain-containing protein [Salipiger mangrovisoli]MBE9639155.1 DUF4297 domain-containing protein [Salipiger mangrovisoli]
MTIATPATTLDVDDPGDDTIARFNYQFSIAAIYLLKMALDPSYAKSIICENFEDLIVQKDDDSFEAIQVKTRDRKHPAFKLTDDAVEKSLTRFAKLEARFPGKFLQYKFLTNHELWEGKENGQNLAWILQEIEKKPTIKRLRSTSPKRIAIENIARRAEVSPETVVLTLSKTICITRREDVTSIDRAVQNAVGECRQCEDLPYKTVVKLSEDIVAAAHRASCKGRLAFEAKLYTSDLPYEDVFTEVALRGKTLSLPIINELIDRYLAPQDEPVEMFDYSSARGLPKGLEKMFQKMAEGEVEARRIDVMADSVRSLEVLKIRWVMKFGAVKAKEMYNDLLSRILHDCVEAQIEAEKLGKPYGSEQYRLTRLRLENRLSTEKAKLYGCKIDHLMGAAGILTENCKNWWSDKFDLQEIKP